MKGRELARLRRSCGWSQYELADILGVQRGRIQSYERGRAPVPSRVSDAVTTAHVRLSKWRDAWLEAKMKCGDEIARAFDAEPLARRSHGSPL